MNGTYHQKVIIDRPNIVLVGENRDSTLIVLAETAQARAITEYHGRPVGNGVIVLQEGADDCVISGLTVYNNYGTAVENTTIHQMAIFGRATVPSSSTVMYGLMETMPFPCGRRKQWYVLSCRSLSSLSGCGFSLSSRMVLCYTLPFLW